LPSPLFLLGLANHVPGDDRIGGIRKAPCRKKKGREERQKEERRILGRGGCFVAASGAMIISGSEKNIATC
jgi:hypothetical protein